LFIIGLYSSSAFGLLFKSFLDATLGCFFLPLAFIFPLPFCAANFSANAASFLLADKKSNKYTHFALILQFVWRHLATFFSFFFLHCLKCRWFFFVVFGSLFTLHSCWPEESSSYRWREKHLEQANKTFPLILFGVRRFCCRDGFSLFCAGFLKKLVVSAALNKMVLFASDGRVSDRHCDRHTIDSGALISISAMQLNKYVRFFRYFIQFN